MGKQVNRREFLKFGTCGLAGVVVGSVSGLPGFLTRNAYGEIDPYVPTTGPVRLRMEEAMFEMVDGIRVYHWAYRHVDPLVPAVEQLRIPGIVIFATEGDLVKLDITNGFPGGHGAAHSFAIPGVVDSGPIPLGQTAHLEFRAPAAGTYFYLDPLNHPVNRVMGLHGAFIVMPRLGNLPYSNPTQSIRNLFDDLGSRGWTPGKGSDHFPGHPWDPRRQWIWLHSTIDPAKNQAVRNNPTLSAATFEQGYLPQYYTMNGKAGIYGTHGPDVLPEGNVGQPGLIRYLNAGLYNFSPHIHGNHEYVLSETNSFGRTDTTTALLTADGDLPLLGGLHTNIVFVDTIRLAPGDRKDVLVPFILPPDIPRDTNIDFANAALSSEERQARGGTQRAWPPVEECFPLVYPMHCHTEPSQTAAGGNYPQGLVAHWAIDGDVDMRVTNVFGAARRQDIFTFPGIDGVITVDRADFNLRVNKVEVTGAFSGLPGTTLEVFAGPDTGPTAVKVGEARVGSDGRWAFRGRALAAAAQRLVSLRALPAASFGAFAGSFDSERLAVRLRLV